MVQSPAVAKASVVGVAGSVLSIFNVLFSLIQLVVSPEEIYREGERNSFKAILSLVKSIVIMV